MEDRGGRLGARTLRTLGRALRHRNYRLFFVGQGTSLVGTWLTRVATSWLVYRLTHSAFLLGLVSFAGQLPTLVVAPLAGVLVDRWNRHRVLWVTQVLALVQSALLAAFTLTGRITVWLVLVLAAFQGLINAFDTPARQAFVVEMVEERQDLANAIALNSSMVNAARLLGPSLAGVLIAAVGEGLCFTIDAVSYLAVIASLFAMRVRPRTAPRTHRPLLGELGEGLRYGLAFGPIRSILGLVAMVSLLGMPYTVLMPVFASQVVRGGAHTLGFLMAASGAGALLGVLWLASRPTVLGLGRVAGGAAGLFGLALVAFSRSRHLGLSLPLLAAAGAGMMVQLAASNTILQTIVDDDKRGRVMSLYTMAFFGMAPLGSLVGGWLGERIGAPATVLVCGLGVLVTAGAFVRQLPALRERVRPIYQRLGIVPELAPGVSAAPELLRSPEE
jgi:MFS family permease